jgi:L-fucose isomerase-like protein
MADPLRVGFVPVIRPLFKGDSPAAASASLRGLEALGLEVVTASVGSDGVHVATGAPLPPFAVSDAAEAARAADELAATELDLLLVQHTSFATGDVLAPLLQSRHRLGLWALPESAGGRGARGPLPLNALCGLNMTLSLLDRPEVGRRDPVKWFYGSHDDPWFLERWRTTARALRGLRELQGARVLQIGGTAPGFYGLDERPELASIEVDRRPLTFLYDEIDRVEEAQANALAASRARSEPLDAPFEQLVVAARIEIALLRLVEAGGYRALAVRCWPELPERCGGMACLTLGASSERRVPASCEGDVMGALSMLALQGVSGRPAALLDLADLDVERDTLQLWHCGNAPQSWAQGGRTRLTTHFNRDGVGVVRDMMVREGPASTFRLLDGGRRALVASGSFELSEAGYDGVRGWLGDLRWSGTPVDARTFIANVLDRRLPHHFALGHGRFDDALAELAAWLGAEPLPALPATPALRL